MRALIVWCALWGLMSDSVAQEPATFARHLPLVTQSLLLDATYAKQRLVAVGEYGHVLLSDDEGKSWRQAKSVPTRTTLTAVTFVDEARGWAVGHGGQILATVDGGETWQVQYGAMDGEDHLFSVSFDDAKHGIAVGSYGYALRTNDGGRTWEQFYVADDEDGERHLNQIFQDHTGRLYIAAESGTIFLSDDGGTSWRMVSLPYEGSMWGGEVLHDGRIMVFGMSGHAFLSTDRGESWRETITGTDQSLTDVVELEDGRLVVAGLGGAMSFTDTAGAFIALVREDRQSVTSVLRTPSMLLLFTQHGVLDYPLTALARD